MKLFRKRDFITVGFILIFSAAAVYMFYVILKPVEVLPVYQPAEVNEKLVDSSIIHVAKYHKISDFKLTNQNGKEITQANYKDKIYVADFFITTCQDICPVMTKNMYQLQEELKNDNQILLLSHTVIPEVDTVEQLKKYAIENNVDIIFDSTSYLIASNSIDITDIIGNELEKIDLVLEYKNFEKN